MPEDAASTGSPTGPADPATNPISEPSVPYPVPSTPGRRAAGQPLWSYFLTPAAVLVGSLIIAAAVWVDSDTEAESKISGGADAASVATTPAPAPTTSAGNSSPTDVLVAFLGYAGQLNLDQQAFRQCLGDAESAAIINTHLQRGSQLGVSGTPTFFINNKKVVGAQPAAIFDEIIAAELKGSPTSLDGYSASVRQLAASNPPRFEIVPSKVDVSDAFIEGDPGAKVMIAEFSDFQCPFCKQWVDATLKRVRSQLGKDVALAFLHFPIVQIHPNAGKASLAAVCAGKQGKFAQMHDILFNRQTEWAKLPSD